MVKNGLFILSIGLFIVMLSGSGDGESTNYLIMVTGLFLAGIGAYMAFGRKKKIEDSEKK